MKRVLLIGAKGSMGRRYIAILKSLGRDIIPIDIEDDSRSIAQRAQDANGIIIASPTQFHVEHVRLLANHGIPIMCEKPLAKNMGDVDEILSLIQKKNLHFRMVMQYRHLCVKETYVSPRSFYDYYNTGKDGLIWDCIQVIGLSRGGIALDNRSPTWQCKINEHILSLSSMDFAYIQEVKEFLSQEVTPFRCKELFRIHEKTAKLEEQYGPDCNSLYWDPST